MEVIKYRIYNDVYEAIKSGMKNTEIRLYNDKSSKIKKGDLIQFSVVDNEDKKVLVKVTNLYYYKTTSELWEIRDKILTNNIKTKEDLKNTLYKIFGEDKVKASKFVAIEFSVD